MDHKSRANLQEISSFCGYSVSVLCSTPHLHGNVPEAHIHTLSDTHCYSPRLQMISAPSQVFQQQKTSISILQKAPPHSIIRPLSFVERLSWLKTCPSFLMENKRCCHQTFEAEPQVQERKREEKTRRSKRPVGRTKRGDVQSEASKNPGGDA